VQVTIGQGQAGEGAVGGPVAGQGQAGKKSFVKKGDFLFVPAGNAIDFANKGAAVQPFAIFELK
jgi:glyoxylate utilization-related uncharacterized protein